MPKVAKTLTPLEVKHLKDPGFYAVGGVSGLHLRIKDTGARSWILRTLVGGKRRDIGLGGASGISLKQARELAADMKQRIKDEGIDPVLERASRRSSLIAAQAKAVTFEDCAKRVIAKKQAEAGNPKHAKQWASTLETYAYPVLGKMAVGDIELAHIVEVLEPYWAEKTETMTRVRQRIEAVLAYAITHGYRETANPAVWKGCLDNVLPSPSKITKVEHHRALKIDAMHDFMADLRQRQGNAALCLEFTILTATRSGEARGARWDEIDLEGQLWTIPAGRMKAGKEHRVPLSDAAVKLLKKMPREGSLVFPATRGGKMSDAAMSALLKRMGVNATVHGFRSTFRDWVAERTSTPNQIAEMALAHVVQGVEGAYRRGDLLAKRARLMEQWAKHIDTKPAKAGAATPIRDNHAAT
ncbi:tyrosine-type recombinase/integrase [Halomonas sp. I1]|uniref:tyrosine-type recombinase/integrase n=1 Tax=Halomonas sp. I1 TaxID=393536 RepID=UPI0028DFCFE8|nr:tyrosine-type recombinase/integrase [Halomonas sp. I1]MDT8895803.1 tyrosine-type recombinase/integrase [Halomonas sp. I1]